jgi:hypothetical protein
MLSELKKLHVELLTFLDDLERLTGEATVRPDEIAAARLKLTRASRRRSSFLETTVYPALISGSAGGDIQRLRDTGQDQRSRSTQHIAKWTLAEIVEHWVEYRAASRTLRAAMRDRIREEQAVLYPLMEE